MINTIIINRGPIGPAGEPGDDASGDLTSGPVTSSGGVSSMTNSALNGVIGTNPAATRAALTPETAIYASAYGVVYGDSTESVAIANVAALNTAIAASSTLQRPLVLQGNIYVKGRVKVANPSVTIYGYGAALYQQDTGYHGIEITDETASPSNLDIFGLAIYGQGISTHLKAGIYGRKWTGSAWAYLGSDFTFRDMEISGFETGTSFAEVAMLQLDHVSCRGQRIGHDWHVVQTAVALLCRIVGGGTIANSTCWKIDGGSFATKILGGEFGGNGIEKFAIVTSGKLFVESANMEAFTGNQIIDLQNNTQTKWVSLKNSRIAVTQTTSQAVISAVVNGNVAVPFIEWSNNDYSSLGRRIEIHGTLAGGYGPITSGEPVQVVYAATQGGTAVATRINFPGMRDFRDTSLPSSSAFPIGGIGLKTSPTSADRDDWMENPIIRRRNNRTGVDGWSSLNNDMLARTLYVGWGESNTTTTEKSVIPYTLEVAQLAIGGESLEYVAFGETAANGNNKTFKFYYGDDAAARFTFGPFAANAEPWKLTVTAIKFNNGVSSGGVKLCATLVGGATIGNSVKSSSVSISHASALSTKITVTGVDTNDITMHGGKVTWSRTTPGI